MDFMTAVTTCLQKYAGFSGRARRSEYWFFVLFWFLGGIVTSVLDAVIGTGGVLNGIFTLALLLPALAAAARRLHDTNHSGWWQVATLVPAILAGVGAAMLSTMLMAIAGLALLGTAVMLLIWLTRAGDRGPNRFGQDPIGAPVMAQRVGTA